ncbi:MAG TPA: exodeoxyribonuclease VII small subunit [Solirubrobacteraceae bacterium]|nr:exodeoxyribonuclease VII small subunit [Solirubrobacteraceae bacterium]
MSENTASNDDAPGQTYETAAARVEEIIRRLDSGEASLNETLELVGEGKALIEFCARELESVSGALQELRLDELIERLERGAPGAGIDAGEDPVASGRPRPTGEPSAANGETP